MQSGSGGLIEVATFDSMEDEATSNASLIQVGPDSRWISFGSHQITSQQPTTFNHDENVWLVARCRGIHNATVADRLSLKVVESDLRQLVEVS